MLIKIKYLKNRVEFCWKIPGGFIGLATGINNNISAMRLSDRDVEKPKLKEPNKKLHN